MFKGFRFRRGLTTGDFANQSRIAEERIKEWERRRGVPRKAELQDIATALNTSVFELLEPIIASRSAAVVTAATALISPLYEWDADKQRQWGALPHSLWGYLRLQLTSDDSARWYPLSGEEAASVDRQFKKPSWATMIVALTHNNRCVMFAPQRVTSASLVDKATVTGEVGINSSWDADGHPPELYRALRAWAQKDIMQRFGTSHDLATRVQNILRGRTTCTRQKVIALVDHTIVHHIDGRIVRFSATASSLQSAVRSVPLGALTVYLDEYQGEREYLAVMDDVRAVDIPATDLKLVSRAVMKTGMRTGSSSL